MQTNLFLSTLVLCLLGTTPCLAQGGSPLPGNDGAAPLPGAELRPSAPAYQPEQVQRLAAPVPVQVSPTQAPTPGRKGATAYGQLPLTVKDAKNRIVELRTTLAASGPSGLHDPIYQLSEWLADSADAHIKMSNAFSKHDDMKAQCAAEKQIGMKFSQLKRDAQLLKADLLIAQKRYPEALNPLVEIVLADPTSATGKTAYQRLKDLGFSHEAEGAAATTPTTSTKSSPSSSEESVAPTAAESAVAAAQTSVKGTVKSVATVKTVANKTVVKAAGKVVPKPTSRPITIAAKRRVH